MDDYGFYMILTFICLCLIGIAGGISSATTEANIAYACQTYSAATIDGKVYICTPRGEK